MNKVTISTSNMNRKISYVTIVNEHYLPLLEKLITTHQLFCRVQLTVFTVNFEYTGPSIENVNFIKYVDENILEYETTGSNHLIKNDSIKYKYTTMLKPKILNRYADLFEHSFFIDCDGLLTKNSDNLFFNSINEYTGTSIPVPVNFYEQYSNHGNNQNIFNEDGSFNINSLTYLPLCQLYGVEPVVMHYKTTYCLYYTSKCCGFFNEVESICFDTRLAEDYDRYLPLGDETAFNYLYAKYKFETSISSLVCYNIRSWKNIDEAVENLKHLLNAVSFIHTKRHHGNVYDGNLIEEDYSKIINTLMNNYEISSKCEVLSFDRNVDDKFDKITFKSKLKGQHYLKIISLQRPDLEEFYILDLEPSFNYYVIKLKDKIFKDLYIIISKGDDIIDSVKL